MDHRLKLPSVPQGHWGSCAYVALGDNLMRVPRGKEIDDHDMVMRLGHAPLEGYEQYVGSRTGALFCRVATNRKSQVVPNVDIR